MTTDDKPVQDAGDIHTVELARQPVELFKVLKFEALVDSGGEAKLVIADGQVSVNGAVETRKRRKLVSGDVVDFAGQRLLMVAAGAPGP